MEELAKKSDINVLELLIQISNDVSAIKTDLTNLKDSQTKDRADINKCLLDTSEDSHKEVEAVKEAMNHKVNQFEERVSTLEKEVDVLKHAEEKKDANKWKVVTAFILTAVGGMVLAKIPDFISYLMVLSTVKGGN